MHTYKCAETLCILFIKKVLQQFEEISCNVSFRTTHETKLASSCQLVYCRTVTILQLKMCSYTIYQIILWISVKTN